MNDYTTTQLIADIKRIGSVPTSQQLYDEQDFVDSFSDCQKKRIIANVMRVKEEYFVATKDFEWSELTELGGHRLGLKLPERTIGNRIRALQIIDADGIVVSQLPLLTPEYNDEVSWFTNGAYGYIFQGNTLILSDYLRTDGTHLRLKFFRRPNNLAIVENAGKITAINLMTGALTLDNRPTQMIAGVKVDIISSTEPFDSLADSEVLLAGSGFSVQVSLATAALLSVGDYVCFEFQTVIPQLPVELHTILVQYGLAQVLASLSDQEGAAMAMAELPELERNIYELLAARDDGSEKKGIRPNGLWHSNFRSWRR